MSDQPFTFYDHRVTQEGLYIRGHGPGQTIYGAMVEIFIPRDEAELFGWLDDWNEEWDTEKEESSPSQEEDGSVDV